MADPAESASAAVPEGEKEQSRGHVGLVVLCSIAGGLILGLVLVLGVFGGGPENVITGAALIALGIGMLMLFELSRGRTDQPQPWALVPAVGLGAAGLALGHVERFSIRHSLSCRSFRPLRSHWRSARALDAGAYRTTTHTTRPLLDQTKTAASATAAKARRSGAGSRPASVS